MLVTRPVDMPATWTIMYGLKEVPWVVTIFESQSRVGNVADSDGTAKSLKLLS
jgi:hypothetical protein